MPDFKILRGSTTLASGFNTTITEGVDYTLEPGISTDHVFIRITNTRMTGMGRTSGGGNQNLDDFTIYIDNINPITTSVRFARQGAVNNCRIEWEIIQYIGPNGGPNEFIVREADDLNTTGTTAFGASLSTISDPNRVWVCITGQATANTGRTDWQECLFDSNIAAAGGGNYWAQFIRELSSTPAARVSWAMIEFVGTNWRDVQRVSWVTTATAWTTAASTNSGTQALTTTLLDLSKAFIDVQYRTSNNPSGLDDAGDVVELDSTTQLRYRNRVTSGTRTKTAWVMENTQSGEGEMSVEHISVYNSDTSAPEEKAYTESITSVDDMEQTSIMGECCSCDGGGTAYPRGSANVRLTAVDTVTWTVSDSGQEERRAFDVVQWPTAPRRVFVVS